MIQIVGGIAVHLFAGQRMETLIEGVERLGIGLAPIQIEQFRSYYDELVEWNARVNLTSVSGWEEVQTRHFLDSLSVASALPSDVLLRGVILDVGSGAGFPGLPLKIVYPRMNVTLLDAAERKTDFLRHLIDVLDLHGVEVVTARAETQARVPQMRERFHAVVSRAVARLNVLAELCLPFCAVGGVMVVHKGPRPDAEVRDAKNAIDTLGGRVKDSGMLFEPSVGVGSLVVIEKQRPTPPRYPRRPGIPSKRPL